jgi:hypothetical protein
MADKPINMNSGQKLTEHELQNRQAVAAMEKSAEANAQTAEASAQAAEAFAAMKQHLAAQLSQERVRMAINLLCEWTHGRPGRIDRATIQDALATVDDLLALANGTDGRGRDQ